MQNIEKAILAVLENPTKEIKDIANKTGIHYDIVWKAKQHIYKIKGLPFAPSLKQFPAFMNHKGISPNTIALVQKSPIKVKALHEFENGCKKLERMEIVEIVPEPKASADDRQVGGSHYKDMQVQPWTAMQAWMSREEFLGFLRGNIIKYAARSAKKGGIEDLKKLLHYAQKYVEVAEAS